MVAGSIAASTKLILEKIKGVKAPQSGYYLKLKAVAVTTSNLTSISFFFGPSLVFSLILRKQAGGERTAIKNKSTLFESNEYYYLRRKVFYQLN